MLFIELVWSRLFVIAIITAIIIILIVRKERKHKKKVSAEADKINKMLECGKISETEANELKHAIGFYPVETDNIKIDGHIQLLSIFHIVNSLAVLFIYLFIIITQQPLGTLLYERITDIFIIHFGNVTLDFIYIVVIIELASGVFLLKKSNLARWLIIALSFFIIFSFPLGTALGIYSLWVLLIRENANFYFTNN
jgi:hypothetical protein